MASAIVRDVVVAGNSSTTGGEENPRKHKCNSREENIDKKVAKTNHDLVEPVCTCTSSHLTTPLFESLPSNSNSSNTALVANTTAAVNNETFDFRHSQTNCLKCRTKNIRFQSNESLKLNISSSKTFRNTSTEVFNDENICSPNRANNSRSLGKLQKKRSPLYGPLSNTPTKAHSLRCQKPIYSPRIQNGKIIPVKSAINKYKKKIDFTAKEALSMNDEKQINNGPLSTLPKSNWSKVSNPNRDNGEPKNSTIMTSANTEKREHLYKILVIGELGTGKTSFIKRYVHQFFSQNYRATIGVDFALKVLHWDPNTIVRLQLWDIAGQERFGNMTRVYYKEAVGAFIVFDVTRSGTFDCVSKWKEDLDSKVQLPDGSPIPCILLANKCDQDKQGVVTNSEKMDEYVKEHGFAGWFETSAKENINIDEAARALVNKILLNDKLISAADLADSEKFNLNNPGEQNVMDGKNKCSC